MLNQSFTEKKTICGALRYRYDIFYNHPRINIAILTIFSGQLNIFKGAAKKSKKTNYTNLIYRQDMLCFGVQLKNKDLTLFSGVFSGGSLNLFFG